MSHDRLAEELNRVLDGLSPVEKALHLAEVLRVVWGGEWKVDAFADGGFRIRKVERQ